MKTKLLAGNDHVKTMVKTKLLAGNDHDDWREIMTRIYGKYLTVYFQYLTVNYIIMEIMKFPIMWSSDQLITFFLIQ